MKKFFFSLLLNILVYSFVFNLLSGVSLPKDPFYLVATYIALSIGIMLQKPVLKFLTVKINLLTYWLSASLISFGVLYLLVTFMPGLEIAETVVKEMSFGAIKVESFKLDIMLTMIASVLVAGLISGIMEMLKKPVED